jgi:ankyrin repeat protein
MEDFLAAASSGDIRTLRDILNTLQDNPAATTAIGAALHVCCGKGKPEVTNLLLDYGADVNALNSMTPLHCACSFGHLATVKLLLQHPNITPSINHAMRTNRRTPLHCAAYASSPECPDIVSALLQQGAAIDPVDKNQRTPLMTACRRGVSAACVERLLESGANPGLCDDDLLTCLHYAAVANNAEMTRSLLLRGADANFVPRPTAKKKDLPLMPLIIAARNGALDVCRLLIQAGADVNAQSSTGRSALHFAASGGHVDVVSLLLENRAAVNQTDNSGLTALSICAMSGGIDVATLLMQRGADPNIADPKTGWLPLHFAAKAGHHVIVALLAADSNTNINAPDSDGR